MPYVNSTVPFTMKTWKKYSVTALLIVNEPYFFFANTTTGIPKNVIRKHVGAPSCLNLV